MVPMSESSENYLETIYELSLEDENVKSVDVAKLMNVTRASVNKAIGVLRDAGMVEQELYGSIKLTSAGTKKAKAVNKKHSTIQVFFSEVLGVDEETANNDACRIEHVISESTMQKWSSYLDDIRKK